MAGPVLDTDITADFVIIGAGFAGLSAARRLRQLDGSARIVVLEAGAIAEAASGRNSGFMIDLPHDLASDDYAGDGVAADQQMIALNRAAIAFGRESVEEYAIAPDYFDPSGKVNGAIGAKAAAHNDSYAHHLDALGEPYELLDEQAMRDLTGSPAYRSGLFTSGTVTLQPAGYVRGLADGLAADGVHVFENAPVTEIAQDGSGWAINTPSGSVSTEKVILANNGHLASFGFAPKSLMQLFLFASMTEELSPDALSALGGAPRWGITPADPLGTTMRRIDTGQGGNRIITRTAAVLRQGMDVNDADLRRAAAKHRQKFDLRFPQLPDVGMQYSWAGHLCLTRNGVALVREMDRGVYSAAVQNGLGTTRGTLTGIAAAEMAYGASSEISEFFTSEPSPKPLPKLPFWTLGANGYLRVKEFMAGSE